MKALPLFLLLASCVAPMTQPGDEVLGDYSWELDELKAQSVLLVRDGNAVQVTEVVNRSGVDIWWAGLDARGFSFFGTTPASEEGGAIGGWGGRSSSIKCGRLEFTQDRGDQHYRLRPGQRKRTTASYSLDCGHPEGQMTSWRIDGEVARPSTTRFTSWPARELKLEWGWKSKTGAYFVAPK